MVEILPQMEEQPMYDAIQAALKTPNGKKAWDVNAAPAGAQLAHAAGEFPQLLYARGALGAVGHLAHLG